MNAPSVSNAGEREGCVAGDCGWRVVVSALPLVVEFGYSAAGLVVRLARVAGDMLCGWAACTAWGRFTVADALSLGSGSAGCRWLNLEGLWVGFMNSL